jgi:hypothetical protein
LNGFGWIRSEGVLRLLAAVVVALFLTGSSCQQEEEELVLQPPIRVLFTVPADSAQLADNRPRDISIDFQRELRSVNDVVLRLYPEPISSGEKRLTLQGRNLTWFDVATVPGSRVQHLLIDGPKVVDPTLVRWFTGDAEQAEFSGELFSPNAAVDPHEAVVFAVDLLGGFNPLDPVTFTTSTILAASTPFPENELDQDANYRFGQLLDGSAYIVLALYDLNSDGLYDPRDDWWAYFGDMILNDPEPVVARVLNVNDPPRGDIDITLRPPLGGS